MVATSLGSCRATPKSKYCARRRSIISLVAVSDTSGQWWDEAHPAELVARLDFRLIGKKPQSRAAAPSRGGQRFGDRLASTAAPKAAG